MNDEEATGSAGPNRPSLRGRFGPRALAGIFLAALAVVVIGIAAGRGGDAGSAQTKKVQGPACAGPIKSVDRPDAVPANLLPPGTVLTSRANLPQQGTLVTGVIPLKFRSAVDFYVTTAPRCRLSARSGRCGAGRSRSPVPRRACPRQVEGERDPELPRRGDADAARQRRDLLSRTQRATVVASCGS